MANPQQNPQSQGGTDTSNGKGPRQLAAELEAMANQPPPEQRETLGRAMVHLVLFIGLLVGVGLAYKDYAERAGKVFNTLREVRDIQRQDSYDKLKESREKLQAMTDETHEGRLVSLLAETDVLLACVHLDQDVMADAVKYTDMAASDDVKRAERYSAEAYLQTCQGKAAEAEAYMVKILNKGAATARVFHALAVAQMAQGKVVEAHESFKAATERGGGSPRFPASLGEAELRLGNYPEAVNQYMRAVNTNGNYLLARMGKALAEGLAGYDPEKVLTDLSKALQQNDPPPSPGEVAFGNYAMAELLTRVGALNEARKALKVAEKVVGFKPDARHHLLRGKIALLKGEKKSAAKAFAEAATAEPTNPAVYMSVADLYEDVGMPAEALAVLQASQKAQVPETPAFLALLGDVHQSRGKPEDAAKAYQQTLEKEEGNVRATIGTARLLLIQKKWEEAGGLFEKVTQLDPNLGDPWYYMCGAYIEQKDYNYAAQMCDKSVELYGKRNAEPRAVVKALKLAAKAYELGKDRKAAEDRSKRAHEMEKAH